MTKITTYAIVTLSITITESRMKSFHIIANWKMYFRWRDAIAWFHEHVHQLGALGTYTHLGFAVEFTSLDAITRICENHNIAIGAQTCSHHEHGAYTGEVPPQSLADMGCSLCIVGHSERRAYHHEDSHTVANKACKLVAHHITPIVCIGETEDERNAGMTQDVIEQQLEPVVNTIPQSSIYIAYEPRWAIGSGQTPTHKEIESVADHITTYTHHHAPHMNSTLLYGGSVKPHNSRELASIDKINGFLIGSASCDFQKLQNIIYSVREEE